MDFTPGEAEAEVSRLAAQVLAGRDAAAAGAATDFDTDAWKDLAQAGCWHWRCRPGLAVTSSEYRQPRPC